MLIVGLGNPGPEYVYHRHNIGFRAIDALAEALDARFQKKFRGELAEGRNPGHTAKIHLLKPMTFMNLSGRSVGDAVQFYKWAPEQVVVVHDDLDLALGQIRVKRGGGNGGHNGLKSIDAVLGTEYWRVRIGIGHPGHRDLVSPYVLGAFTREEETVVARILAAFVAEWSVLLTSPLDFSARIGQRLASGA